MRKYLPFMALALLVAAPASARDFPMGRVEANIGWDKVRGKVSYRDSAFPEDNASESASTNGVIYGGTVGIDMPYSGIYVGLEASFDLASNERCTPVFGDDRACFDVKRTLAAGGRIGVPFGKRALGYVGAAYVNGRAKTSYRDDLDASNNISGSDSRDGYRLSTGLEYRVMGNMFTKLEYRYSNFSDYSISSGTEKVSLGFDRHQVVGGVGVRF